MKGCCKHINKIQTSKLNLLQYWSPVLKLTHTFQHSLNYQLDMAHCRKTILLLKAGFYIKAI